MCVRCVVVATPLLTAMDIITMAMVTSRADFAQARHPRVVQGYTGRAAVQRYHRLLYHAADTYARLQSIAAYRKEHCNSTLPVMQLIALDAVS